MSVVDVYDNVLESHVAEFIEINMKDLKWEYDYHSKKGEPNKHWHIFCGHDLNGCIYLLLTDEHLYPTNKHDTN